MKKALKNVRFLLLPPKGDKQTCSGKNEHEQFSSPADSKVVVKVHTNRHEKEEEEAHHNGQLFVPALACPSTRARGRCHRARLVNAPRRNWGTRGSVPHAGGWEVRAPFVSAPDEPGEEKKKEEEEEDVCVVREGGGRWNTQEKVEKNITLPSSRKNSKTQNCAGQSFMNNDDPSRRGNSWSARIDYSLVFGNTNNIITKHWISACTYVDYPIHFLRGEAGNVVRKAGVEFVQMERKPYSREL